MKAKGAYFAAFRQQLAAAAAAGLSSEAIAPLASVMGEREAATIPTATDSASYRQVVRGEG